MHCYDQLDISKTCEDITIATSREDLSTLETWSSAEFKMKQVCINSTQDGKDLSSSPKSRTRILPTDLRGRTRSPQLMEHGASQEVLCISCQRPPPGFQFSIKKHDPSEFNSNTQDSFSSRISTGYLEYQNFIVVKGTANHVVRAKGMSPAAL